jgi:hypothetical protein
MVEYVTNERKNGMDKDEKIENKERQAERSVAGENRLIELQKSLSEAIERSYLAIPYGAIIESIAINMSSFQHILLKEDCHGFDCIFFSTSYASTSQPGILLDFCAY